MSTFDGPLLPPEIWREIVARLPVKSVLRCRSVCKSWYSLISSPNFISHYSITNKSGNRTVLRIVNDSHVNLFISHGESCMESGHDDDSRRQVLEEDFAILGSCNGLLCLCDCDYVWHPEIDDASTVTFLIWNPAIRKKVELPSIIYSHRAQEVSLVGFGFDPNTSDYKVFCNFLDNAGESNNSEIFDLRKGAWRSISPPLPPHVVRCPDDCPDAEFYVDGALHWSVFRYDGDIGRSILSFNMIDESFREMSLPGSAEFAQSDGDVRIKTQCETLGGLLHVIVWKITRYEHVDESESCSVWAMKEYGVAESWIKVSNIDLQSARVLPSARPTPHHFILWGKGEVVMMQFRSVDDDEDDGEGFRYNQYLVLYNTGSGKSRRIFSTTGCVEELCRYKESLVLM